MRVFISSVRRGLEAERDTLPGLIMALGEEPKRFEDFGAQAMPSREACLRGVTECDVYLLLLGPNYGHVFSETGQSATHDEWVAAIAKGMPRLVFRKTGVEFEPEQEEFAKVVGDYGHGVFYAEFTDVVDLQPKVVQALRSLEMQPATLRFSPLRDPVQVTWREDRSSLGWSATADPWLELHVVPLDAGTRSARQLRELPTQLVTSLRAAGVLAVAAGAEPQVKSSEVVVELPQPQRRWDEPRAGGLADVRVTANGQVSLSWSLPADSLGAILDVDLLPATIARGLRLIGAMRVLPAGDYAIGIGLGGGLSRITEGRATGVARTSVSMSATGARPVRVPPDEAVTSSALDRGADVVADSLVQSLVDTFRAQR